MIVRHARGALAASRCRPGLAVGHLVTSPRRHRVAAASAAAAGAAAAHSSSPAAPCPQPPLQQSSPHNHAVPHYADLPLDRASTARKDPALAGRPDATALLITPRGDALVVGQAPAGIAPAYAGLPAAVEAAAAAATAATPPPPPLVLLLGVRRGTGAPVYAVVVPTAEPEVARAIGGGARWESVVATAGPGAGAASAAVLALASGLAAFQASARFDATSGAPLVAVEGGHAKRPAVAAGDAPPPRGPPRATRPRVDPAVLVLVTARPPPPSPPPPPAFASPPFALLGRKPSWPPRRYSLLAGFVELGESLEGAAVREVGEESGVGVDPASLAYAGSQPWPFPRSLMVAYEGRAVVAGGKAAAAAAAAVTPEDASLAGPAAAAAAAARAAAAALAALPPAAPLDGELADVRWFPLCAVADAVSGWPSASASGLAVPGPHALAHTVLKGWAAREGAAAAAAAPAAPLPPVNPGAACEGGPDAARRSYILACVMPGPSGDAAPYLIVRAEAGSSHAALVAAVAGEAAASGAAVDVLGGGWLGLSRPPTTPPAALTELSVGGPVPAGVGGGVPRHGLAACVLRAALPLHEVEEG